MRHRVTWAILPLILLTACAPDGPDAPEDGAHFDPEAPGEGVGWDEDNPYGDPVGKADQPHTYEVPADLPELSRPEVIVSLDGLTVHLFDRALGLSWVYPTGVGTLGASGRSITPRGFFRTHADPFEPWYNIPRRYQPDYFGGFPFIRLNALNSAGHHTYGLHGPISYTCPGSGDCGLLDRAWFLKRDYVSHGCMRMDHHDVVELFYLIRGHSRVPVSIQGEVERDAAGMPVDVDQPPAALWQLGEPIDYGDCGVRPDPYESELRWSSSQCG